MEKEMLTLPLHFISLYVMINQIKVKENIESL